MNDLCSVPSPMIVHNSSFAYIQVRKIPPAVLVNVINHIGLCARLKDLTLTETQALSVSQQRFEARKLKF